MIFLRRFSSPEGTKVNSRGRAVWREAPGRRTKNRRTLKGSTIRLSNSTLSGSGASYNGLRGLRAKPLAHGYLISSFQDERVDCFDPSGRLRLKEITAQDAENAAVTQRQINASRPLDRASYHFGMDSQGAHYH